MIDAVRTPCACRASRALLLLLALAAQPGSALPQSVLTHSPNLPPEWTFPEWHPAFVLAHRFEFIDGGNQLLNVPTLSLALPLPAGFAAGLDFTSNSEIVLTRLGRNETQLWLSRRVATIGAGAIDGLAAYNSAAQSFDGLLSGRVDSGPFTLLAAGRVFSDVFGLGTTGAGATVGAVARLTPQLALLGDAGRVLEPDTFATVWSAGVGVAIPGTRHTFSLHASNSGATTVQGAVRPKVLGPESTRYGFTFTAPLGTRAQWARVFRTTPVAQDMAAAGDAAGDTIAVHIAMRDIEFLPREVRIRVGDTVEWVNADPVVHTATATDRSWGSPLLEERQRWAMRFTEPGRYEYFCLPHPQMTGVIIVEER